MSPRRIMIFGTFDLLHPGHESLVEQAMVLGLVGIVVARDENVKRIKGKLPVENLDVRMKAIRDRFPSVEVIAGDENDFLSPLRSWKPDILLLGYDQKLPPGVSPSDLPCPVKRAHALEPERFKSSLMTLKAKKNIDQKGKK